MIAALVLALLVLPAPQAREGLAELRELAELDLPGTLIRRGRELFAGPLSASGEARAILARALFAAGEEDEALALLEPADLAPTERVWLELERARLLIDRDELSAAAEILAAPKGSEEPVRHADHPDAWILFARIEARAGRPNRAAILARGFLERAALHPEAPVAWHLLAQEALARRDGETAARYLERAAEIGRWLELLRARRLQVLRHPDQPLPRLGVGLAWMQVGEHSRAREAFRDLCSRHPGFARGWYHLGEANRLAGDLVRARESYATALGLDASMHQARFNGALLDLLAGRTEAARAGFEHLADVVQDDPLYAGAHLHLARLDLARGNRERALTQYSRYRALGGTEPLEE